MPEVTEMCIDSKIHNFVFLKEECEEMGWHNFEHRRIFYCTKCLKEKKVKFEVPQVCRW